MVFQLHVLVLNTLPWVTEVVKGFDSTFSCSKVSIVLILNFLMFEMMRLMHRHLIKLEMPRKDVWDLVTSPHSALILSQRKGKVCMDSLDTETKWEWKLRNYSFNLKFSIARRGVMGRLKRERGEMISISIVSKIGPSCLQIEQL